MKTEKFVEFAIRHAEISADIDLQLYVEQTGREIPREIHNENLPSLLFVSWLREQICKKKKSLSGVILK